MPMYDLDEIRKKLAVAAGNRNDPDEFKPAKAQEGKSIKYYFYILAPVTLGTKLKGGTATEGMENFFVPHGLHWINNKPYACPRVCSNEQCEICGFGFDLMKEVSDRIKKTAISKIWMPAATNVVNIYFPPLTQNPEELRGKVMYYKAPKTCFDMWQACIYRNPSDVALPVDDELGQSIEPYGIFFDESAAWLYQLEVTKNGDNNEYKKSAFVVPKDGKPRPMIKDAEGKPDRAALDAMLSQRHYIIGKLDKPNLSVIKQQFTILCNGGDGGGGGGNGGFDQSEDTTKTQNKPDPDNVHDQLDNITETLLNVKTETSPKAGTQSKSLLENEAPLAKKTETKVETKTETKVETKSPLDTIDNDESLNSILDQLDDV